MTHPKTIDIPFEFPVIQVRASANLIDQLICVDIEVTKSEPWLCWRFPSVATIKIMPFSLREILKFCLRENSATSAAIFPIWQNQWIFKSVHLNVHRMEDHCSCVLIVERKGLVFPHHHRWHFKASREQIVDFALDVESWLNRPALLFN